MKVCLANWSSDDIFAVSGALIGEMMEATLVKPRIRRTYADSQLQQRSKDVMNAQVGQQLTKAEIKEVREFLLQYEDLFSVVHAAPRHYSGPKMHIDTGDATPIRHRPRRQAPWKEIEIDRQIAVLLENGLVEASDSPWAFPIVMVKKKDGTSRMCCDYRTLNDVTRKDSYPLPRIDDTLDAVGADSKIYSTMDMASSFHTIPLDDVSKEKTAFTTRSGLYQFKVMPGRSCLYGSYQGGIDRRLRRPIHS
jgi:hypothetical protein